MYKTKEKEEKEEEKGKKRKTWKKVVVAFVWPNEYTYINIIRNGRYFGIIVDGFLDSFFFFFLLFCLINAYFPFGSICVRFAQRH